MHEFTDILERLQCGDEQAASEMVKRYRHRRIGLAKSKIGLRLRAKIDPEDVVQSAFHDFFVQAKEKQVDLENFDDLWRLLSFITLRKCFDRFEHFQTRSVK